MKVSFSIGDINVKYPIIQGGMGVGVSLSNLAGSVALEGGIGVISGVQIGYKESDFETNTKQANLRALKREIRLAKQKSNNGIIGVNLMVAMTNYDEMVKVAVEEEVDLIISGAGLPTNLPSLIEGTKTKAVPIVSSGKATKVLLKLWDRKFNYTPDLIIIEGCLAGGHLGFSFEEIESGVCLEDILEEVIEVKSFFEDKYKKKISIAVAGGIFDGKDIAKFLKLGADAVQMGTRFVATHECDASLEFKQMYVNCKKEDIKIIKSPVGLPGRAISNNFVKSLNNKIKITKCYSCLRKCNPNTTPYCISKALIESVKGNVDNGLVFVGNNAYKIDEITSVKKLIGKLINETKNYLL